MALSPGTARKVRVALKKTHDLAKDARKGGGPGTSPGTKDVEKYLDAKQELDDLEEQAWFERRCP